MTFSWKQKASLFLITLVATPMVAPGVQAAPQESIPAGCSTAFQMVPSDIPGAGNIPRFLDGCYHARTGLNGLDTPVIDVLIVPPASMYPERDLRVMRQAIEMWDEGIHFLAQQMGYDWLHEGVKFSIFTDDDKLSTDPLWDPEIVVVATNPAGGAGIGVDSYDFLDEAGFNPLRLVFPDGIPCKGAPNPVASLDAWNMVPRFDNHHGNSGTYVDECQGGPVCFAVNGAIDPVPGVLDFFGLFDLVAHEVGHCLSAGHVGDAGDHKAAATPFPDIMSYTNQPHDKCVSTLDVEAFAIRMSGLLLDEPWTANHPDGPGTAWNDYQIMHPDDYLFASSTGLAQDCPQPDAGLVPGLAPISFTPVVEGAWPSIGPGVDDGDDTLYFHRKAAGPAGSSGNLETACVGGLLEMDDGAPQEPLPAAINAFGGDGGDHNPCYDAAEWVDAAKRRLHDASLTATFWFTSPLVEALEAQFEVILFADNDRIAETVVSVLGGAAVPNELVATFPGVTAEAASGHTLSVSIDPVFILWGGSNPQGVENLILYDSPEFPSRLEIKQGIPGDADGDGVPDGLDACPGHDDAVDADGDGAPDGCDDDDTDGPLGDADGDGVLNPSDQCPGHDDTVDSDGDGTPDGCDAEPFGSGPYASGAAAAPPRGLWVAAATLEDTLYNDVISPTGTVLSMNGDPDAPAFSYSPGFGASTFVFTGDVANYAGGLSITPPAARQVASWGLTSVQCDNVALTMYMVTRPTASPYLAPTVVHEDVVCDGDFTAAAPVPGYVHEWVLVANASDPSLGGSFSFGQHWQG